jgi:P27 family predicted phage terminase small subunit
VAKIGEVVKTRDGNLIQNPYLAVANRAMDQMLAYGRELGLSPSSRSRLSIAPPAEKPNLAETLFRLASERERAASDQGGDQDRDE